MKYDYVIGIDPGTHTGLAIWNGNEKQFNSVVTMSIHAALFHIKDFVWTMPPGTAVLIRIEDARKRKWYGQMSKEQDTARTQGVGSIKRDCSIWEDFCKDYSIPYEMVKPGNIRTKMNEQAFLKLTGWEGRTSEHARDAALLVFQHN